VIQKIHTRNAIIVTGVRCRIYIYPYHYHKSSSFMKSVLACIARCLGAWTYRKVLILYGMKMPELTKNGTHSV
jgi:hypothetical protein